MFFFFTASHGALQNFCDRGSEARDGSRGRAQRSTNGKSQTNGRQYVSHDINSNIFNIANCNNSNTIQLQEPES